MIAVQPSILAVFIFLVSASFGADWEYLLARKFSSRFEEIETVSGTIRGILPELPAIPVADQGGTGGFASLHSATDVSKGGGHSIEVHFAKEGIVDLVVLVPARRYGISGLESQFGLPDGFVVELLDAKGNVIRTLAKEEGLWADSVRAGHPFVFPVQPPVEAGGLRVRAQRLRLDSDVSNKFVHAWAEAFVFEGERNLARGASVSSSGGLPPSAPWLWNDAFLVDEETPLGIPEIPSNAAIGGGWISMPRQTAEDSMWIEIDLGNVQAFDAINFFPAARPTLDLPNGFGFPRRFTISFPGGTAFKDSSEFTDWEVATTNPGNNPFLVQFDKVRSQKVRIVLNSLWKAYDNFPAYAAFSELEVLAGGKNIALGTAVQSSESELRIGRSKALQPTEVTLTDGLGQRGRLVPTREWLLGLDQRLKLERELNRLEEEKADIIRGWRITGWIVLVVLAGVGALLLIVLPVRYRLREKLHISQVRDRIAGDLHDEVGSNLGSIQMLADLAEGHAGSTGPTKELKRIQRIAAETVSAVRDIVWLLRPQGDHRIGTVEHLRETSSIMLEPIEWEFTANEAAWQCEMSDESNRHLFLFFREALHNLLRHAGAKKATIRVECDEARFHLTVADDGYGIPSEKMERPSTLRALRQRVEALGAEFKIESRPGEGTRLELRIPLQMKRKKKPAPVEKPGIAPG